MSVAISNIAYANPNFKDHDSCEHLRTDVMSGKAHYISTDIPTQQLSPDMSSCGVRYYDHSAAACVKSGWLDDSTLGKDSKGNSLGCFRYIELENTANRNKAFAQVLDTCGAVVNTSFSCHDLILTTDIFTYLAGDNAAKAMNDGQINSTINWKFVQEPCESCWTGEFGRTPDGKADTCEGPDSNGVLRSGRKKGAERKTTKEELKEVCQKV